VRRAIRPSRQPLRASSSASAHPRPLDAPVTTATELASGMVGPAGVTRRPRATGTPKSQIPNPKSQHDPWDLVLGIWNFYPPAGERCNNSTRPAPPRPHSAPAEARRMTPPRPAVLSLAAALLLASAGAEWGR